jgi:hypothetical protein
MNEPKDGAVFAFNVKQYEEHRAALLTVVKEERQMEQFVVLGCAGFYSWFATANVGEGGILSIAAFVPVVIIVLAMVRSNAIENGVRTQAEYLRRLEAQIYSNAPAGYAGPKGWESFLASDGEYVRKYENSQRVFWYLMLVLAVCSSGIFFWVKL